MGESDSTVSQPPKPVCDWSLGRLGGEVKGDFPEFFSTVQTVPGKPFTRIPVFPQGSGKPDWTRPKACAETGQLFEEIER
jgi:hypothetical protein